MEPAAAPASVIEPTTAAPPVFVIVNRGSGIVARSKEAGLRERIRAAFRTEGLEPHVVLARPAEVDLVARQAAKSSVQIVVAAGGDGTISGVAGELAGTDKLLGILPVGTLNHFAKDIGIPLQLADAVRVIAAGTTRSVDVGDVNGNIFINNSSIGLYPQVVIGRERQRLRFGRGKWFAMAWAFVRVFRRFPLLRVTVDADGSRTVHKTPLLFVGNNRYELNLLTVGRRTALDRGELCLYMSTASGRFAMIRLALRALFGRLEQGRDFVALFGSEFQVASRRRLHVARDGEIVRLTPPLLYRSRPRSLRVLVPEAK